MSWARAQPAAGARQRCRPAPVKLETGSGDLGAGGFSWSTASAAAAHPPCPTEQGWTRSTKHQHNPLQAVSAHITVGGHVTHGVLTLAWASSKVPLTHSPLNCFARCLSRKQLCGNQESPGERTRLANLVTHE